MTAIPYFLLRKLRLIPDDIGERVVALEGGGGGGGGGAAPAGLAIEGDWRDETANRDTRIWIQLHPTRPVMVNWTFVNNTNQAQKGVTIRYAVDADHWADAVVVGELLMVGEGGETTYSGIIPAGMMVQVVPEAGAFFKRARELTL